MKITKREREILEWMADGNIACRTNLTMRWLADKPRDCTTQIKSLQRKELIWTHFPRGSGHAGINEAGRAVVGLRAAA